MVDICTKVDAKRRFYGTRGKSHFVYLITPEGKDFPVKVGCSNNPDKRLKELQPGNADKLVVRERRGFKHWQDAAKMESWLLFKFLDKKAQGEWVRVPLKTLKQNLSGKPGKSPSAAMIHHAFRHNLKLTLQRQEEKWVLQKG